MSAGRIPSSSLGKHLPKGRESNTLARRLGWNPASNASLDRSCVKVLRSIPILLFWVLVARAQTVNSPREANELVIAVNDENGVAIPAARVDLQGPTGPL